jgi:CBS domain-containing protein
MTTVQQLLNKKGNAVWSVSPDDTVYEALQILAAHNIGAVLVLENDKLVGILSERDYARKVVLQGKSSLDTSVRTIMTHKVYYVQPQQKITECLTLMADKHIRHLPVLDGERVVGVISIGDAVKWIIADQQHLIDQLEHYIVSS